MKALSLMIGVFFLSQDLIFFIFEFVLEKNQPQSSIQMTAVLANILVTIY